MAKLDEAAIQKRAGGAARVGAGGDAIRRQFTLASFPDAIAFVTRLAFDAEAADHHPDILINYKRVTLTYSTHSEGGLTQKDFDGARKADAAGVRAVTELKNTYTTREVAAMTGLTARQLQWWDARRVFASHIASKKTARGGYTERRYTPVDLLELRRARRAAAPGTLGRRSCGGCSTRCASTSACGCSRRSAAAGR